MVRTLLLMPRALSARLSCQDRDAKARLQVCRPYQRVHHPKPRWRNQSETHIAWRVAGVEEEIAKAVEAIAELALLGAGDIDKIFPESLDEVYAAYGADEMEWRVVL